MNSHFVTFAPTTLFSNFHDALMDKVPASTPRRMQFFTAIAYILSSHGARELVRLIDERGWASNGADVMLLKVMDLSDTWLPYATSPSLVELPMHIEGQVYDSDLERDRRGIPGRF